ncbi:hypothetical protein ABZX39_34470 [Streptomyces collinus]|uniref:hypothetical protein n=1 Tax=Streptomyces collinus TaxID=42684 RepID=UPI00339F1DB6
MNRTTSVAPASSAALLTSTVTAPAPELTDEFGLFFHALDTALGLCLPERDLKEGTVRAARWARAGDR